MTSGCTVARTTVTASRADLRAPAQAVDCAFSPALLTIKPVEVQAALRSTARETVVTVYRVEERVMAVRAGPHAPAAITAPWVPLGLEASVQARSASCCQAHGHLPRAPAACPVASAKGAAVEARP